jgi:Bacterial PH domain
MALIRCGECASEISDKATACPRCGVGLRVQPAVFTAPQYVAPTPFVLPILITPGASAPAPPTPPINPSPAEQPIWEGSPSRKAMIATVASNAVYAIVIGVLGVIALNLVLDSQVDSGSDNGTIKLAIVALVVLAGTVRVIRALRDAAEHRGERYLLSTQRIHQAGLSNAWDVPLRDIEAVSANATWIENLISIGDVKIRAKAKKVYHLLDVEDPASVREQIRDAVHAATGTRPQPRE